MSSSSPSTLPEFSFTRRYAVSRERVYAAWAEERRLAQWWGPHGFTTPVCRADARPGGELYLEMAGPAGTPWEKPFPMYGKFIEVAAPEKLVFHSILKNDGGAVFLENSNAVTFTESAGYTTMILHVRVITAGPEADGPISGMHEGWSQSLERLETYLAT